MVEYRSDNICKGTAEIKHNTSTSNERNFKSLGLSKDQGFSLFRPRFDRAFEGDGMTKGRMVVNQKQVRKYVRELAYLMVPVVWSTTGVTTLPSSTTLLILRVASVMAVAMKTEASAKTRPVRRVR